MKIVPLSKRNLKEAIALGESVFPHERPSEGIYDALNDYLELYRLEEVIKFRVENLKNSGSKKHFSKDGIVSNYWVAEESSEVVGVVGLDWNRFGKGDIWLGWFYVKPSYQGQGIGSKLLDFSIEQARKLGFKRLRVLTTDLPNEKKAQRLYERQGLKIYRREKGKNYTSLYRKLQL